MNVRLKNVFWALLLFGVAIPLAAFVGLFIAIQFGTMNLDPDAESGNAFFDVIAVGVGFAILGIAAFGSWKILRAG